MNACQKTARLARLGSVRSFAFRKLFILAGRGPAPQVRIHVHIYASWPRVLC
jgi:hypothetical protein